MAGIVMPAGAWMAVAHRHDAATRDRIVALV